MKQIACCPHCGTKNAVQLIRQGDRSVQVADCGQCRQMYEVKNVEYIKAPPAGEKEFDLLEVE